MDLDKEKILNLKNEIIKKISSSFPEDKKEYAINKVKNMSDSQFIEFLKNNKLGEVIQEDLDSETYSQEEQNTTPFRLIAEKKIHSYIVEESKTALAVLEINPISPGHILIIPKKPIFNQEKIPKQIADFTDKIFEKIKNNLKPKEIILDKATMFKEIIINLIPIYDNETKNSPRKSASEEELNKIKEILQEEIKQLDKSKIKEKEEQPIKEKQYFKLPKRIP